MWRMTGARLLQAVPLLFIITAVTFVLQLFIPGDAARSIGGISAPPDQVEALRQRLHLDDPVWVQYWNWLKGAVHGDLGSAITNGSPVTTSLNTRVAVTLSVVVSATPAVAGHRPGARRDQRPRAARARRRRRRRLAGGHDDPGVLARPDRHLAVQHPARLVSRERLHLLPRLAVAVGAVAGSCP